MTVFGLLFAFSALFLNQAAPSYIKAPHIKAAEAAYDEGKKDQSEKQFQRATECFRKAIEIEPTFLDAYESLIAANLDSGQRLQGAAAITQFLEIEPDAVRYRVLLGQILLEQKQSEKALGQFSLVLEREPYNAEGLLGFAAAARRIGMKERADEAIERGRKHYPQDARFKNSTGDSQK